MADIKQAFDSSQLSLTLTSANLATSNTAGWQSNVIDNSSNLFRDHSLVADLAAVNTAPSGLASIYFFLFPSNDGSLFVSTGDGVPSGSVGTLTYPDITTKEVCAPLIGRLPYSVQNRQLVGAFGLRRVLGFVPKYFSIGVLNPSGMTLSWNSLKLLGNYDTV